MKRIFGLILLLLACTPQESKVEPSSQPEALSEAEQVPETSVPAPEVVQSSPTTQTQEELERLAIEQAQRQEQPARAGETGIPPSQASPPPTEASPNTPPAVRPEASQTFLRGKEFLLQVLPPIESPPPYDFQIGQLASQVPVRVDDPKVYTLFTNFLRRLSRGEVARNLIAPTWRDTVARPLQEVINQGWTPTEYRLGQLFWESELLVRASFILRRGKRWAAGLIYAEPSRGDYFVTDVVIDLMDLKKDREVTRFEPDGYPILSPLP